MQARDKLVFHPACDGRGVQAGMWAFYGRECDRIPFSEPGRSVPMVTLMCVRSSSDQQQVTRSLASRLEGVYLITVVGRV